MMLLVPLALAAFCATRCHNPFSSSALKATMADDANAARSMLFQDQHRAMAEQAQVEGQLLDPNMRELKVMSKKSKKQKRRASSLAGRGFGASTAAAPVKSGSNSNKIDPETEMLAAAVQDDGVVLIPGVLKKKMAASLRECVYTELEAMRDTIRSDPSSSQSLFYVPAEIHFSTPRGYILLPFRDTDSVEKGPEHVGVLVEAARELLSPDAPLSRLFGRMCDDNKSQLYDWCALRTEPGATRQVVHADTPYQETPGLFCAFVALQDVTFEMGGTLFVPGTHKRTAERNQFDHGDKDAMLAAAKPKYTMLKAGDAAFFDMRTLHCGLANRPADEGGANRLLMAITFRNLNAKEELGHKPNLRPGYVGRFNLGEFHQELASASPFSTSGNGLLT